MRRLRFILLTLAALVLLGVNAQETNKGTIIPKYLCNGYFFSEMPELPEGSMSLIRLKDNEGNSIFLLKINTELPAAVISKAIPLENVRNAEQFLNGEKMMATMTELTQAGVRDDGSFYSPSVGNPFPPFKETDMNGQIWTNDSVEGHVMVLNLWYSGCGPCRAEMPILSEWQEKYPDVMFLSATYHDAETAKKVTDKHHFTWIHLVNAKDMMSWIGTEGFPLTIVVDKKGIVRYAVHGTSEEKRSELLSKIEEAINE
jgi:thiol-disulfide isomerase/thioredoxin